MEEFRLRGNTAKILQGKITKKISIKIDFVLQNKGFSS